jgi:hypothetical protein
VSDLLCSCEERLEYVFVDVDSFEPTAALPGVVETPVRHSICSLNWVHILGDIGTILPAQL